MSLWVIDCDSNRISVRRKRKLCGESSRKHANAKGNQFPCYFSRIFRTALFLVALQFLEIWGIEIENGPSNSSRQFGIWNNITQANHFRNARPTHYWKKRCFGHCLPRKQFPRTSELSYITFSCLGYCKNVTFSPGCCHSWVCFTL